MGSRRGVRSAGAAVLVLAILASIGCWCYLTGLAHQLSQRGVPTVPGYQRVIGREAGGFFAKWLFVAIAADAQQVRAYEAALTADGAQRVTVGSAPGECRILLVYPEDPRHPGEIALPDGPVFIKQQLNGKYLPWWDIEQVRHGALFTRALAHECRYSIITDAERGRIYVYWSYS